MNEQVYLLYETFLDGKRQRERLEFVGLTPEDAHAWVHAYFPQGYSRTSMPVSVFRAPHVDVPRSDASDSERLNGNERSAKKHSHSDPLSPPEDP